MTYLDEAVAFAETIPSGFVGASTIGETATREVIEAAEPFLRKQFAADRFEGMTFEQAHDLLDRERADLQARFREEALALASHPTPDGEMKPPTNSGQDWMQTSLSTVLRHFESEASAADELMLQNHPMPMTRQRYRVERDVYRYVLKQISEATPDGETKP
jgi:hypothetical protein